MFGFGAFLQGVYVFLQGVPFQNSLNGKQNPFGFVVALGALYWDCKKTFSTVDLFHVTIFRIRWQKAVMPGPRQRFCGKKLGLVRCGVFCYFYITSVFYNFIKDANCLSAIPFTYKNLSVDIET